MIIPREFPDGWNTDAMCPVCGHTLRIRTNRRTKVQFLACAHPGCRHTERISDSWHTEKRPASADGSGLMEALDEALRAGGLVDGVDEHGRTGTKGAGMPFFFKKDGNGKRLLDGRLWEEMPEVK